MIIGAFDNRTVALAFIQRQHPSGILRPWLLHGHSLHAFVIVAADAAPGPGAAQTAEEIPTDATAGYPA